MNVEAERWSRMLNCVLYTRTVLDKRLMMMMMMMIDSRTLVHGWLWSYGRTSETIVSAKTFFFILYDYNTGLKCACSIESMVLAWMRWCIQVAVLVHSCCQSLTHLDDLLSYVMYVCVCVCLCAGSTSSRELKKECLRDCVSGQQ